MKINISIIVFLLSSTIAFTQHSYRKDSLQIKVYTKMKVNKKITIEDIEVVKVFCDYCTEKQIENFSKEAIYITRLEINNPKYRKKGVYQLAHYLRISKKDFSELKEN